MDARKLFGINRLCFLVLATVMAQSLFAKEVLILGNESMPFNGIIEGKSAGMTYEILEEATKHGAPEFKYELGLKWRQAQNRLLQAGDTPTAIVPFTRTKQRENKHTWIAKLISYQTRVSTTDKEESISINSIKRKPIGVIRGSAHIPLLKELGLKRMTFANRPSQNALKLASGKIYGIVESHFVDTYAWQQIGRKTDELQFLPIGETKHIFIAGNTSFPTSIKESISTAIDKMAENGKLQAIVERWRK